MHDPEPVHAVETPRDMIRNCRRSCAEYGLDVIEGVDPER